MRKKIFSYLSILLFLIFFPILQIPIISYGENVFSQSPDEIDQQKMLENLPIGAHNGLSAHGEQWELFKDTRVKLEPEILEAKRLEELEKIKPVFPEAVTHTADPNFIVFGYHPSYRDGYESHYRWHAITHIGYCFVEFDSTAAIHTTSWDSRPDAFKAGGAAQANGVKVVLVLLNQGFDETHLNTVMQSASLRNTLINNVVAEVSSDSYCQGVSLDFELNWGTATRDGITAFCQGLNSSLKALTPPRELSLYVNPSYSSTRHDIPGLEPHLDYMLFSCYPWAGSWSSTVNAISDAYSFIRQANNYIDAGMPPNKVVLSISAYGYRWYTSSPTYGATIDSNIGSMGFITGMYDTTLEPEYGGPYTNNYERSDETGWYTFNDGATRIHVWDDDESLEYKLRLAKSWQDPDEVNNGTRLRGVAFWELGWLVKGASYDPITDTLVSKTRTYGQLYQLCEEIFSPPGDINYLFEKFEGPDSQRDFRWRDPNESPDTTGDTDGDSSRALASAPSGSGRPTNSDNAIQVYFDFENGSGNRIFFRHEILNDNSDTSVTDKNAAKAYFDTTTKIKAYMYVSEIGYSGRQVRMVVMDANNRQLEMSNPYSLATPGWRLLEWDLTDLAQINAYTTSEPAFNSGNGELNTAGSGAKDIAFIGFIIEGGSAGSGTVYFDELSYTHCNPSGKNYVINEFRYSSLANEFVEIYGPAGDLPAGFQLRIFDSWDGSAITYNISGTIPNDSGGYGYFVVGDPAVPEVDFTTGFSASDEIPDVDPSAIQLYNIDTGGVYDSVVYEAYGGLDDLIREQTLGVTQNGYPWLGEIASGTNASGEPYTMGRYPDGNNTYINYNDFSFMSASPGLANGNPITLGTTYNFDTAPPKAFQTFQAFSVQASGVGSSPSGGTVHRCVDTSGGGVISVIGDAALGYDGNGYFVSGEIYIPASAEPAQANGIGICGHQGSNFFTTTAEDSSSYESGYWLIFENQSGVGLNDGRDDHPDVFEFVYATNDNMDGEKVALVGSKSRALTGASSGEWTTFYFKIDPNAASGNRLIAQIKDVDVYRGNIPSGGPISGAFQVGFRENHAGAPASNEGTWIDNISIGSATAVSNWLLY